ncbi:hypothetical protein FM037_02110 [Shewanella psychropiezotolerans]|uniref:Orphan protein n=1 Tax=Shewanella psychropiezotolerans TaxID=2593655 RepID=A0ABX5WZ30_9GAMM|nr:MULTISPECIES: hypothetical protein [Shewanella]MPY25929.1 hypothetical protein [Shewanella sp. YLB-07]QDO82251.1 hypothetical protein FM037_02110 [Shewanella psychropiezotolerans]
MKNAPAIILVTLIFIALGTSLYLINSSEKSHSPETWSSFVYTNGYNSGRYKKQDDFISYETCREHAVETSVRFDNAPWECGLRCRFDSSRQGFQCETMKRE